MACKGTAGNRGDIIFASKAFALAIREPMQRREPGWVSPERAAREAIL